MFFFSDKATKEDLLEIINHIVDLEKQVDALKGEIETINSEKSSEYSKLPNHLPLECVSDTARAGQIVYVKNEFGRYEEWIYLRSIFSRKNLTANYLYAVIKPSDDKVTFVSSVYTKKEESK